MYQPKRLVCEGASKKMHVVWPMLTAIWGFLCQVVCSGEGLWKMNCFCTSNTISLKIQLWKISVCTGSVETLWVCWFKSLKSPFLLGFCLCSFWCQCWVSANSTTRPLHTRSEAAQRGFPCSCSSWVQRDRPRTGSESRGSVCCLKVFTVWAQPGERKTVPEDKGLLYNSFSPQ